MKSTRVKPNAEMVLPHAQGCYFYLLPKNQNGPKYLYTDGQFLVFIHSNILILGHVNLFLRLDQL